METEKLRVEVINLFFKFKEQYEKENQDFEQLLILKNIGEMLLLFEYKEEERLLKVETQVKK